MRDSFLFGDIRLASHRLACQRCIQCRLSDFVPVLCRAGRPFPAFVMPPRECVVQARPDRKSQVFGGGSHGRNLTHKCGSTRTDPCDCPPVGWTSIVAQDPSATNASNARSGVFPDRSSAPFVQHRVRSSHVVLHCPTVASQNNSLPAFSPRTAFHCRSLH